MGVLFPWHSEGVFPGEEHWEEGQSRRIQGSVVLAGALTQTDLTGKLWSNTVQKKYLKYTACCVCNFKLSSSHTQKVKRNRWFKQIFSSVQLSHSVVSDSLRPHESQHARPLCPSPAPGVYPNSRPSSQWCHPAISYSVVPFSPCPQSLPASGSFPMSQLFAWGGQSTGVSASASILPMNTQDLSPLGWTGGTSLQFQGTLKSLLQHHSSKASIVRRSAFFTVQLSHPYMTTGKTIALTRQTFMGKVMSLLFNMLSRLPLSISHNYELTVTRK